MTLVAFQQCRTLAGWVPVQVPSRSDQDKSYTVLVNPWGEVDENICECEGYHYRGKCSHQEHAKRLICGWDELSPRARQQTPHQRRAMECPMCGGQTMWQFRPLEEDDEVIDG
jgi:hypothetical protein